MQERGTQRDERQATLERGRSAFEQRSWRDAYELLAAADRAAPLPAPDLEHLALAAYLTGHVSDSDEYLARAHQEYLTRDAIERATRCAFWIGMTLLERGEQARGGGWLARAQRLLDDAQLDCVERGYLLFPAAVRSVYSNDAQHAYELCTEMSEIAARFHDEDLAAMARNGQGRALIRMGEVTRGLACLDESMVCIEATQITPTVAGSVYCSVIEACTEIFDVRRAQEWTTSLMRWCESQPDLVPFRGQCQVRRGELLQLRGSWPDALSAAQQARTQLSEPPPPHPAVGLAIYLEAELHRLRGDFAGAESAYREASRWGRKPRPGMALLRLAQGNVSEAAAMIRALLADARDSDVRSKVLAAQVEIELAAQEIAAARTAADELGVIAAKLDAPLLHAMSAHAHGAVALAEGEPETALRELQRAWQSWQQLDAPYEAARVRVLIAEACHALGDHDTATVELDAARAAFEQLGAGPDIERIDSLAPATSNQADSGLTPRELEVLRLVAQGKTNRVIADELFISERTVHRHVSNIFLKLGLSTRAAATAYAFQHHLV